MEEQQHGDIFTRSEQFEINNFRFNTVSIDRNRLVARSQSWAVFEILISFIGACWRERWRRSSDRMLYGGVLLITFPLLAPLVLGGGFLFWWYPQLYALSIASIMIGIALIVIWALWKMESIMLYTPSETFKIQGSGGFIEAVWNAISRVQ